MPFSLWLTKALSELMIHIYIIIYIYILIIVHPCGIVLDAFAERGISESWKNQ